ncbi:MAG: hypothetical protein JWM88_973 [Verrucomicrobia bacterium]|nr:hypothetical protein [Verrucomicrobiota bacterium]
MKPRRKISVKTLTQAHAFVCSVGRCGIFADPRKMTPTLWDVADFPDRRPGEGGWGRKVGAVWRWKNELPATFPDEIFYGKDEKGRAVLMTLEHLAKEHYPQFHRPVETCTPMARKIHALVKIEPMTTGALRDQLAGSDKTLRTHFSKAMIELQTTLNIVRSNAPEIETDTWLRFAELYPSIAGLRSE